MIDFKLSCLKLLKCVTVLIILDSGNLVSSDDVENLKKDLLRMDFKLMDLAKLFDKSLFNSFQISNSVCLGENVIISQLSVKGLVGYWSFDTLYPLDESGNGNHFYTPTYSGPPSNGILEVFHYFIRSRIESSLHKRYFLPEIKIFCPLDSSYKIRSNSSLDLDVFTLSFRIYLLGDYSSSFRNFMSRNDYNLQSPNILFYPYNNKLSVRVFTTTGDIEGLSSNSSLPLRRWTQVTVVCSEESVRIYINGMLDNSIKLRGKLYKGSGDLVMGRALKYEGFRGYVDELRLYNYAMGSHEVAAFVSDSLTGFDNSFRVQLGCTFCEHNVATSNGFCPSGYKLCSLDQLYISGAHIARVNGWLHSSNQIWYKNLKNIGEDNRAALCCS